MRRRKPRPLPPEQAAILDDLMTRRAFSDAQSVEARPAWSGNAINRLVGRGWIVRVDGTTRWRLTQDGVTAARTREAAHA